MNNASDLLALVLILRPCKRLTLHHHMGRATQQFALDILQQESRSLSAAMHDGTDDLRSYTTSGLLDRQGFPIMGTLTPDDSVMVRLTGLSKQVASSFATFARQPPTTIELDRQTWTLEAIITTPPWAGSTYYTDLMRQHQTAPLPSTISLQFVTATAFRSNSLNVPLPIPNLVFGSLARRWDEFAPFPLPELLTTFIEQHVAITRYTLQSTLLTIKTGKQIGFVGEVMYSILAKNPGLAKHDPQLNEVLIAQAADLARAVALLSDFAFYSGIGIKTAAGMGVTMPSAFIETRR